MSYTTAIKKLDELKGETKRTGYACRANGCPNAGPFDDAYGKDNSGVCYYHWRESDVTKWGAITLKIKANFEKMRNW